MRRPGATERKQDVEPLASYHHHLDCFMVSSSSLLVGSSIQSGSPSHLPTCPKSTMENAEAGPSGTTARELDRAPGRTNGNPVAGQTSAKEGGKGKRKRASPLTMVARSDSTGSQSQLEMDVVMLSQTSFSLQPRCARSISLVRRSTLIADPYSLYTKGNQLNFAKTADNQAVARKRAEESDALRREEKRRLVDGLLAQQETRIRRAGGTPWDAVGIQAGSSVNPSAKQSPQPLEHVGENGKEPKVTADTTSALDTRVPETEEAEFAQKLEAALDEFPKRDPETGQVPPMLVCVAYPCAFSL